MPLEWRRGAPREESLAELIARKKYVRAIEVLRRQLQRRTPTVQMRLQLADVLVLAGRTQEAGPIFIALADELAADGFVAKAVAILKRVERIDPGRGDVKARLTGLVQQQQQWLPTLSVVPAPRRVPEIGIEEITEAPEPAPTPEPLAEAPVAEPASPERGPETSEPAERGAGESSAVPPEPFGVVESPSPPAPDPPTVEEGPTGKIRRALRRFIASLPGAELEASEGPQAPPPPEPEASADATSGEPAPSHGEGAPATPPAEAAPLLEEPAGTRAPGDEATAQTPTEPAAVEEPAPPAVPDAAAEGDADRGTVGERLKGVLRRLLALGGGESEAGAARPETSPGEAVLETAAEPAGALVEPAAGFEAGAEASTAEEPLAVEPAAMVPAAVEPAVELEVVEEGDGLASPGSELEVVPEGDAMTTETFQDHVLDLIEDVLRQPPEAPASAPDVTRTVESLAGVRAVAHWRRLLAGSLFGDLTEDELLAVVQALRLRSFAPGDVIVTEGEPGRSLFILAGGRAKVFVRNPAGRNFEVGQLKGGEFFGEISALSGRPRTATVTASADCEILELERATLDAIARTHPRVCEILESQYIRRASSPEAAAIRAVPVDPGTREKAIEVLEAHFGQSRWEPRMRLRLASVLLRAGKDQDAVDVLIGLADDLAREGLTEKAIALLKKIERLRQRHVEEVNLAPLRRKVERARTRATPAAASARPSSGRGGPAKPRTEDRFQGWLLDVLRDAVQPPAAEAPPEVARVTGYARGLAASPLFEGFGEEELVDFVRGLRLLTFEAGDVIVTEGESGESVFLLAAGRVRVWVRNPAGRNAALRDLDEGSFFGEISALSGRPRSATITAATDAELLELDRDSLEVLVSSHPRVREVLEAFYVERMGDRNAAVVRGFTGGGAG